MCFLDGAGFWIYLVLSLVVPKIPEGEEIVPTDQPIFENPEVIKIARSVTEKPAGRGAVREAVQNLMKHNGTWKSVLARYEVM